MLLFFKEKKNKEDGEIIQQDAMGGKFKIIFYVFLQKKRKENMVFKTYTIWLPSYDL